MATTSNSLTSQSGLYAALQQAQVLQNNSINAQKLNAMIAQSGLANSSNVAQGWSQLTYGTQSTPSSWTVVQNSIYGVDLGFEESKPEFSPKVSRFFNKLKKQVQADLRA